MKVVRLGSIPMTDGSTAVEAMIQDNNPVAQITFHGNVTSASRLNLDTHSIIDSNFTTASDTEKIVTAIAVDFANRLAALGRDLESRKEGNKDMGLIRGLDDRLGSGQIMHGDIMRANELLTKYER